MDRTLRSVMLVAAASGLGLVAPEAFAECNAATVYYGECDFKNEDTHLWWSQPAVKFQSDDDTDRLVNDAWTAVHEYYSTTKTLGDDAIRDRIGEMRGSIDEALASASADLAITLYNDPIGLKPLYTDAMCDVLWGAVLDRECKATNELVLDAERVEALTEVRVAIAKLESDPGMLLGEEWGGIAEDLLAIEAKFDELETIGENLDPDTVAAEIGRRFEGYAEVLAGPKTTEATWSASRREISRTLHATLLDTMSASKEIAEQRLDDEGELSRIRQYSRDSVGRMQQMELGNMNGTQSNQEWLKIQQVMIQGGNLTGLDMADEMNAEAAALAEAERMRQQLPGVGTIVGNERGAILP